MQSFIIASKNQEKGLEKVRKFCFEKNIDEIDITTESFEKTVGIEDIRSLQKKLFLKPLRGENKTLIINASKGITAESQNALLKILEEPPLSTFIFLIIEDVNILLPTIISRCKVIKLKEDKELFSENDISEFKKLIEDLKSQNAAIKLKLAQDFGGSREDAIVWLEKAIFLIREIILKNIKAGKNEDLNNLTKIIRKLEEGHYAVKNTNVNQRFILENTFLNL